MSHPEDSSPLDMSVLKKSRFRFNVTLLLLLLSSALLTGSSLLHVWVKQTFGTQESSLTEALPILFAIITMILFILSIYQTFSFTWDLRFSKGGVFGYMILMFLLVQGGDGNGAILFFPCGALLTLIALNFVYNDVIIQQTADAEKENDVQSQSDPPPDDLEETK